MGALWDTSALIAHVEGDPRLSAFTRDAVTTANNLAELHYYFLRVGASEEQTAGLAFFRESLAPLTASTARRAAELRREHRKRGWSYVDAMTYAAALENGLTLVAVGEEFEGLPGAVVFPRRAAKPRR